MSARERDALIESAVTAYRERDAEGRITPPPAWWDLPPDAHDELFRRQALSREIERAANPNGWSATVMAVMERLGG